MTLQQAYQVQLQVFTGPLDLLMHLIEQQQLDITLVSLAQVTDQYLDYIARFEQIAADELASFVTIAARLLLIKSRVLLPKPPKQIEDQEAVGDDLVRQLREYRRFKQIAQILEQRDEDKLHSYARSAVPEEWVRWEPKLDVSGLSLSDLWHALHELLVEQQSEDEPDLGITPYKITIDERMAQIDRTLRAQGSATFSSLLETRGSRMEVIVTLLAILEMIRHRQVTVHQHAMFGEITVQMLQSDPLAPDLSPPATDSVGLS